MANPFVDFSTHSVVNPVDSLTSALSNVATMYNNAVARDDAERQRAEENRRWDIANTRAEKAENRAEQEYQDKQDQIKGTNYLRAGMAGPDRSVADSQMLSRAIEGKYGNAIDFTEDEAKKYADYVNATGNTALDDKAKATLGNDLYNSLSIKLAKANELEGKQQAFENKYATTMETQSEKLARVMQEMQDKGMVIPETAYTMLDQYRRDDKEEQVNRDKMQAQLNALGLKKTELLDEQNNSTIGTTTISTNKGRSLVGLPVDGSSKSGNKLLSNAAKRIEEDQGTMSKTLDDISKAVTEKYKNAKPEQVASTIKALQANAVALAREGYNPKAITQATTSALTPDLAESHYFSKDTLKLDKNLMQDIKKDIETNYSGKGKLAPLAMLGGGEGPTRTTTYSTTTSTTGPTKAKDYSASIGEIDKQINDLTSKIASSVHPSKADIMKEFSEILGADPKAATTGDIVVPQSPVEVPKKVQQAVEQHIKSNAKKSEFGDSTPNITAAWNGPKGSLVKLFSDPNKADAVRKELSVLPQSSQNKIESILNMSKPSGNIDTGSKVPQANILQPVVIKNPANGTREPLITDYPKTSEGTQQYYREYQAWKDYRSNSGNKLKSLGSELAGWLSR